MEKSKTKLIEAAKIFCQKESLFQNTTLYGVTNGKAVGTFIEKNLKIQSKKRA